MNEIKLAYLSGYDMVFTAFQPDGTGRGIANQPTYEIRDTGYYVATPLTELQAGDMVLAYIAETLTWEGDSIVVLDEEFVFYEGEKVYYESDWVIDFDSTSNSTVTWVGNPVAVGEYVSQIDIVADLASLEAKVDVVDTGVDDLIIGQRRVFSVVDETIEPISIVTLKGL